MSTVQIQSDLHLVGAGMSLSLVILALGAIIITRRNNFFNLIAALQITNCFFTLAMIVIANISYIFLFPQCSLAMAAVGTYAVSELSVDLYLLSLVFVTTEQSKRGRLVKVLWSIGFVIFDAIPRLMAMSLVTLTEGSFCKVSSHPIIGMTANVTTSAFSLFMGFSLCYTLVKSRQHLLGTIGLKSAVFSIVLVIVKISLYAPYVFSVIGPFSVVFIYLQSSLQCCLFNLSVYWKSKINSVPFSNSKSLFSIEDQQ